MAEGKPTIYVETTVPSYLTAWPHANKVVQGHQEVTRQFWDAASQHFDLFISQAVLDEAARGDPEAAAKRLEKLAHIPVVAVTDEVESLAAVYQSLLRIPQSAATDALHLSYTVVYGIDYLVTWNCKHLANGAVQIAIAEYNGSKNLK